MTVTWMEPFFMCYLVSSVGESIFERNITRGLEGFLMLVSLKKSEVGIQVYEHIYFMMVVRELMTIRSEGDS
jgi:hypothetical protein